MSRNKNQNQKLNIHLQPPKNKLINDKLGGEGFKRQFTSKFFAIGGQ